MKLYNIYRAFKAGKILCFAKCEKEFKFRVFFSSSLNQANAKFPKWKVYKII